MNFATVSSTSTKNLHPSSSVQAVELDRVLTSDQNPCIDLPSEIQRTVLCLALIDFGEYGDELLTHAETILSPGDKPFDPMIRSCYLYCLAKHNVSGTLPSMLDGMVRKVKLLDFPQMRERIGNTTGNGMYTIKDYAEMMWYNFNDLEKEIRGDTSPSNGNAPVNLQVGGLSADLKEVYLSYILKQQLGPTTGELNKIPETVKDFIEVPILGDFFQVALTRLNGEEGLPKALASTYSKMCLLSSSQMQAFISNRAFSLEHFADLSKDEFQYLGDLLQILMVFPKVGEVLAKGHPDGIIPKNELDDLDKKDIKNLNWLIQKQQYSWVIDHLIKTGFVFVKFSE